MHVALAKITRFHGVGSPGTDYNGKSVNSALFQSGKRDPRTPVASYDRIQPCQLACGAIELLNRLQDVPAAPIHSYRAVRVLLYGLCLYAQNYDVRLAYNEDVAQFLLITASGVGVAPH